MGIFRRRSEIALYVHLSADGGIFTLPSWTLRDSWVTEAEMLQQVKALKESGGTLLYSREGSERDPPPMVTDTFRRILELEPPAVKLTSEEHAGVLKARELGATTLMSAVFNGNEELVEDLLARGAEVDTRDADGRTALMYAAKAGDVGAGRALLQANADANARDLEGSTPLMFAAQHGFLKAVRALIDRGAEASVRGEHGYTALGLARANRHEETAGFLASLGAAE